MRKFALMSAAAALAAASPVLAQDGGGYVGGSYTHVSSSGDEADAWSLNGAAAFGDHFQIDGQYANFEAEGASDSIDFFGIGGHAFMRNAEWLLGGYLGYNQADFSGDDVDEWNAALQGQAYLERTTLSGALSYGNTDFPVLGDFDHWAVDGEIRHFFADNFSIQGNAGYADVEDLAVDASTFGVGAEWQFEGAPVSIHGGYQRSTTDLFGADDVDNFGVGVRLNWGGSLLERNRSGAGLARPLSLLERAFGGLAPR
jgi:hypothetical protein